MSPGYLYKFRGARCPYCGGSDPGNVGFIRHHPDCLRSPCVFCGLEVMYGEKRTLYRGATTHQDCIVDFEEDQSRA